MANETPVLDTIAAMTLDSVERCGFDPDALLLVRIAAFAWWMPSPLPTCCMSGPQWTPG